MTTTARPMPRQPMPALEVPTAGGPPWSLAAQAPQHFTMLVFFRGLHCPICRTQLRDLEAKLPEFDKRGVSVIALSSDDAERAIRTKAEWGLPKLTLGYGLTLDAARGWGLYISSGRGKTSIGVEEPAQFSEPGLFLVRPDGTLYFASIQTMPFARPQFADVLNAVDFVVAKDYPARGEVAA
jgi:peroxiredoxin